MSDEEFPMELTVGIMEYSVDIYPESGEVGVETLSAFGELYEEERVHYSEMGTVLNTLDETVQMFEGMFSANLDEEYEELFYLLDKAASVVEEEADEVDIEIED